jgi:hypothetical protein
VVWLPNLFTHIQAYWSEPTFIRDWYEALASQHIYRRIGAANRGEAASYATAMNRALRPGRYVPTL